MKSFSEYLSAFTHAWIGRTLWLSIADCSDVSSSCAMSGRSPPPSAALYLSNSDS